MDILEKWAFNAFMVVLIRTTLKMLAFRFANRQFNIAGKVIFLLVTVCYN